MFMSNLIQDSRVKKQLQKDLDVYPYELFNGSSNGTITPSDKLSNYNYIDILCSRSDNLLPIIRIYNPIGKTFELNSTNGDANSIYVFRTVYSITDNAITPTDKTYKYVTNGGNVGTSTSSNYFKISQVIGYK